MIVQQLNLFNLNTQTKHRFLQQSPQTKINFSLQIDGRR